MSNELSGYSVDVLLYDLLPIVIYNYEQIIFLL